jgi:hypothetical protein
VEGLPLDVAAAGGRVACISSVAGGTTFRGDETKMSCVSKWTRMWGTWCADNYR